MPRDKSLWYYGKLYRTIFDRISKEGRNNILELIAEGSRVLDAGCGTGKLAIMLREKKNCQVVGVDLSLRMINFAKYTNPYEEVTFLHRDVEDISDFEDKSFDYTIVCLVIHELPFDKQLKVIAELIRLGKNTIILDHNFPLPKNIPGLLIRMIEATFGRDHNNTFKVYIAAGGVVPILEKAGVKSKIAHRLVFNNNCSQIVVLGS